MAASSADKITQARGTAGNPVVTTVSAARTVDGTSLTCTALTNWPTDTQVHFITYSKNADGSKNNSSQLDWKGTVSSSTSITSMVLKNGTDAGNAVGDYVEMGPTATWAEDLYDALTSEHSTAGTHDNTKVAMLAGTQTFTGNKTFSGTVTLPDSAVTTAKIADDAVTAAKIDWASTGANGGIWWEELGRATLSTTADTITVSSLPARKYLRIYFMCLASGAITAQMRFNGDTGSNYSRRVSANNAADTTVVSTTSLTGSDNLADNTYGSFDVINISSSEKLLSGVQINGNGTGAAQAPTRYESYGKWANTSSQITSVTLFNGGTGDYAAGTEIVVLGHN